MRHLLVACAVALLGPIVASITVSAQVDRHRPAASAAKAPRGQNSSTHNAARAIPMQPRQLARLFGVTAHFGQTASRVAAPSAVPLRVSANRDNSQRYANSTIWLYASSGYPLFWSGAYTPAFVEYYPVYPYFLPSVSPVAVPAADPRPADPLNLKPQPANVNPPEPAVKPKARTSTADQKTRAGKLIAQGDVNFGKQQFAVALERYRSAGQYAPDVPEPFFRQGHALVAMGQYDNASKAFRRGLKIRSDWNESPFRLDQIYGDGQIAKVSHLENLAKAIETNPLDSNLLTALGVELFFDGQRDRAIVFLTRVAQLGGNQDQVLNDLLTKPGPADAQAAQPQGEAKIVF